MYLNIIHLIIVRFVSFSSEEYKYKVLWESNNSTYKRMKSRNGTGNYCCHTIERLVQKS